MEDRPPPGSLHPLRDRVRGRRQARLDPAFPGRCARPGGSLPVLLRTPRAWGGDLLLVHAGAERAPGTRARPADARAALPPTRGERRAADRGAALRDRAASDAEAASEARPGRPGSAGNPAPPAPSPRRN